MKEPLACPFCHELFAHGEHEACPACGLTLMSMSNLPLSEEARLELEEEWDEKPEYVSLGTLYWRRGRGALVAIGLLGMLLFWSPWIDVTSPEIETLTGTDMARLIAWLWACPVAWGMLIATALSRRSIGAMRGARVITALFCALPLVAVVVVMLRPPTSSFIPVRFQYALPFYATALLGVLGLPFAVTFGGRLPR